jgi:hypothetical protein
MTSMKKPLDDLLQKEMDRKEFIATLGFGAASLLGLSTVLQLLGKNNSVFGTRSADIGYGSSAYGGDKKAA